jgi:hypothetical protein
MNLSWITQPLVMYGAIAAGAAAALHLFISGKADLRRMEVLHDRKIRALGESLAELQGRLASVEADAGQEARLQKALVTPLPSGLNRAKRSEALRMCSRGADVHRIAATLGLSRAEAVLLVKLHPHLTDARAVPQSAKCHQN